MNYYFLHGETPLDVVRAYTRLTGVPGMPPLWALRALGYHQCKWSYYRESTLEVTGTDASLEIARTCEGRWSPGYAAISILLRGLPDGTEAPRFEVDGQPITATTDALGRPVLRVSPEFKQVTIVL